MTRLIFYLESTFVFIYPHAVVPDSYRPTHPVTPTPPRTANISFLQVLPLGTTRAEPNLV